MKSRIDLPLIACCAIGLTALAGGCTTPSLPATPPTPATPTSSATAPLGPIAFLQVRSPVTRGSTGEVTLQTTPGASCSLVYSSGSDTRRLDTKTADGSGIVTWSWTLESGATPGAWPIDAMCGGATARAMFRIQ